MSFNSGFDVAVWSSRDVHRQKTINDATKRWSTPTTFDRAGKPTSFDVSPVCNQEPTSVECRWFEMFGHKNGKQRDAALERRIALNGGSTPVPPHIVAQAVGEAYDAVWPKVKAET